LSGDIRNNSTLIPDQTEGSDELEQKLINVSEKLETAISDRNRLLKLSNKLKAKLRRSISKPYSVEGFTSGFINESEEDISHGMNSQRVDPSSIKREYDECIKIADQPKEMNKCEEMKDGLHDLPQKIPCSLSSSSMVLRKEIKESVMALKASDRATFSQREKFKRLQTAKKLQMVQEKSGETQHHKIEHRKVRNWNMQSDDLCPSGHERR